MKSAEWLECRDLRGCFSWFQAVEVGRPGNENPVGRVKESFLS